MSMMPYSLARPYGLAIYQLAAANNQIDDWRQVINILSILIKDESFAKMMKSPTYNFKQKYQFISQILQSFTFQTIEKPVYKLIALLLKNNRITLMPFIEQHFIELLDHDHGVVELMVLSLEALETDQLSVIKEKMQKRFGCDVRLLNQIDASLLGGIKIKSNDRVIDFTFDNTFNKMQLVLNNIL